jgi:LysM repeat protein
MGSVKRSKTRLGNYLPFLALNVVVSVCAVLGVLFVWNLRTAPPARTPTPTMDVAARIASVVPTSTPTLPPSPTVETYVVQPGDSLYAISQELDIPMGAIMQVNGIVDASVLAEGQVLIIPSDAAIEAFLKNQTVTPGVAQGEQTPTAQAEAPQVEIVGIDGTPGDLETEAVRIQNTGGPAVMAGWEMDDGEGQVYTFPSTFTLYKGAITIHTRAGDDTVIDLYWGLEEAVWVSGKIVTIRDAAGTVQSRFEVP